MNCEYCSSLITKKYGSGRFCSIKCARGFATKNKRKEINEKVRKTLTGTGRDFIEKTCPFCKKVILTKKLRKIYCSNSCRALNMSEETKAKISKKLCEIRSEGKFKFSSIRCDFEFNNASIRCDSFLEKRGLIDIISKYSIEHIQRSKLILEYTYDKIRRYNPDFEIKFTDGSKGILECKTSISENSTKKDTRPLYFLTVPHKKEALIKYCSENFLRAFWFDGKNLIELK